MNDCQKPKKRYWFDVVRRTNGTWEFWYRCHTYERKKNEKYFRWVAWNRVYKENPDQGVKMKDIMVIRLPRPFSGKLCDILSQPENPCENP